MPIARRWTSRLLWAVCVLVVAAPALSGKASATDQPTPAPAVSTPESPTAGMYIPEVRIRKLHLVRPDLIPYPIAYEIVC
jgi:hypothetical protein